MRNPIMDLGGRLGYNEFRWTSVCGRRVCPGVDWDYSMGVCVHWRYKNRAAVSDGRTRGAEDKKVK